MDSTDHHLSFMCVIYAPNEESNIVHHNNDHNQEVWKQQSSIMSYI